MLSQFSRRARIALLTLITAVLGIAGIAAPSAAGAAVVSYGASTAHPYSDPVWWPVTVPSNMGCYHANAGCGSGHSTYVWDVVGKYGVNNQPIYAMGAGIVHIGASGIGCGGSQTRGNFVYVDHGHGVLTYYGHLGRILVRSGQYVSPRTALAYMGNSGYSKCRQWPGERYVMLAEKTGGTGGRYVEIAHTYACPSNGGSRVTWPQQLPRGAASHWNAVHNGTAIPATSSSRSCISVPSRTATKPALGTVARRGSSAIYAAWARPWPGYGVGSTSATLSIYHPSIHRWSPIASRWMSGSATSVSFGNLAHNRQYSVTVRNHNAAGWSATSTKYASTGR